MAEKNDNKKKVASVGQRSKKEIFHTVSKKSDDMNLDAAHLNSANDDLHLFSDSSLIIDRARRHAYSAISVDLVKRNWLLGKRISEELLIGQERAEYGKKVVSELAAQLTERFGKGFAKRELYRFVHVFNNSQNSLFLRLLSIPMKLWVH